MEKFANFILKRRNMLFWMLVIFAAISIYLTRFVVVNLNVIEYLPPDSSVRAVIEVMEAEFSDYNVNALHVMFDVGTEADEASFYEALNAIENVAGVRHGGMAEHLRTVWSLYTVTLESGLTPVEEYTLVNTIRAEFSDYNPEMSGGIAGVMAAFNMQLIIIPTAIILTIILFAMCHSWFEPVIFFINIAIAILINEGTNAMFDHISNLTQMITGLLQVVLSMDYSIIFLNRYRQEKEAMEVEDHYLAMKNTIINSFSTISGIAFTTIVGMLMLVFMSFTLGGDIGVVIAKGVFISLICVFGVMPALILRFDKWIDGSTKPALSFKMGTVGRLSYKARYVVAVLFVVVFAGAFVLQNNLEITYSEMDYDPVYQVFDLENPFLLIYEHVDEEEVALFVSEFEHKKVDSIVGYSTTFGQRLTEAELAEAMAIDELLVGFIYRNYFIDELPMLMFGEFLQFMQEDVVHNPLFADSLSPEELAQLEQMMVMMQVQLMEQVFSAPELAGLLQMDVDMIEQLFAMHGMMQGAGPTEIMAIGEFLQFMQGSAMQLPMLAGAISPAEHDMLRQLPQMMLEEMMIQELTADELAEMFQMDASVMVQLFYLHHLLHGEQLVETMTMGQFIDYLITDFARIPMFEPFLTSDDRAELEEVNLQLTEGVDIFVAENFSRIIINTTFAFESEETFAFMDDLNAELSERLTGEFHLFGTSILPHELNQTFSREYRFITMLTTFAFFVVAAISFKSMPVSAILAIVIQASVFITMSVTYFQDGGIMFLSLIIAQILLKSRVIDYGILYTANYIEARKKLGVKDAIIVALNHSINTILTSGLIIVLVTFVVGLFFRNVDIAMSSILLLIAQGCFIGVVMSIFVLPSLVAVFDKFVTKAEAKGH